MSKGTAMSARSRWYRTLNFREPHEWQPFSDFSCRTLNPCSSFLPYFRSGSVFCLIGLIIGFRIADTYRGNGYLGVLLSLFYVVTRIQARDHQARSDESDRIFQTVQLLRDPIAIQ